MNKTGSNYTAIQDLRTPHADAKYIELDDVKPDSLPGWLNSYYNTNLMNVNTGFDIQRSPREDYLNWLTRDPRHHLEATSCSWVLWVPVSLNDSTNLNHVVMAHRRPRLQLLLTQASLLYSKLPPTMIDVSYHTIATFANALCHCFLWRHWGIGTFLKDVAHILHMTSRAEHTYKRRYHNATQCCSSGRGISAQDNTKTSVYTAFFLVNLRQGQVNVHSWVTCLSATAQVTHANGVPSLGHIKLSEKCKEEVRMRATNDDVLPRTAQGLYHTRKHLRKSAQKTKDGINVRMYTLTHIPLKSIWLCERAKPIVSHL